MCHASRKSCSGFIVAGMVGTFLLFCAAGTTAATQESAPVWTCRAEGVYTTCSATRSLQPCQDYRTEGIGIAEDKVVASIEAEGSCSDQLLRIVSLEILKVKASIKAPCGRVACELNE